MAVLRVEGVSKSYGDVRALRGVSLAFDAGEVHAVLGENGAGKSTLMGVLAGFVVPDSGTAELDGASLAFGRPHETRRLGIEMVHQHFMLVPAFSAAENFALGTLQGLRGALDLGAVRVRIDEVARDLGWEVDPDAVTRDLPVGVQQRLEIVKALAGDARVLILDEPTAVLSPQEVLDLFRVLRRLRDAGKCVVLIAHKLSEVLAVADRVTVLREGSWIATAERAEVDEAKLANWMVGEMPAPRSPLATPSGAALLAVTGLRVHGERGEEKVRGVSFTVARGEVLGIGGVDGNGQNELAEALVGLRRTAGGEIVFAQRGCKIGFVPQDRQGQGLALGMSVLDNVLIAGQGRADLWRGPFLRRAALRKHAAALVEAFEIKVGGVEDPARSLSGGNQQKLVVSRILAESPDLIVASNPTRGLDVRATAYVQGCILGAARRGAAVVLFSTDLDELAALATRTFFMSRGSLATGGAEALVGGAQ